MRVPRINISSEWFYLCIAFIAFPVHIKRILQVFDNKLEIQSLKLNGLLILLLLNIRLMPSSWYITLLVYIYIIWIGYQKPFGKFYSLFSNINSHVELVLPSSFNKTKFAFLPFHCFMLIMHWQSIVFLFYRFYIHCSWIRAKQKCK